MGSAVDSGPSVQPPLPSLGSIFRTPSLGLYWRRCRRSRRSCPLYSSPPVLTSFHNTGLLLLRCPAGYFGPRCLQTEPLRVYMPSPYKSMFARHERSRTESQSGTGAPLRSAAAPPPRLPLPPVFSSSFLLLFLLLRSSPNGLCTTPRTWWHHPWNRSASAVCTCPVVLIPCLSPSLPPSLLPSPLLILSFFHTLSFPLHPFSALLSHSSTLLPPVSSFFCGFVSFHQVSK